ncbi:MAG: polyribonucleotide nucleotidyltransferase [Candidatus Deianiraeaceae bacterium]|jgi:polyribonucleotide nucleotidyltransferase
MFNIQSETIDFHGKQLTLETGKMARQADGAVMVTFGKTQVLCTVCYKKDLNSTCDFLPLMVVYQEKFYANGKIPGGFLKREAKPSDREVLTSRLIDRSIRPLFDANFNNEIQVICTVMSYDEDSATDIPAMIGAVAALKLAGAPINATIAGVRVGIKNDEFYINNANSIPSEEKLDIFVAGTKDSILMVESEIKELPNNKVIEAIEYSLSAIGDLTNLIEKFSKPIANERFALPTEDNSDINKKVKDFILEDVQSAFAIKAKQERTRALANATEKVKAKFVTEGTTDIEKSTIMKAFHMVEKEYVRAKVLKEKIRIDGRKLNEVRPISIDISPLALTHGSALFTRGETQALAVLTLGSSSDEQMLDSVSSFSKDDFMLHYNFPGFSVGEVARMMGPGRREIGHGSLAKKAIVNILPEKKDFPYTKRVVSEVLESNGSSSMATVCGTSLALMSGGVPTKGSVSGIAMGLVKDGDNYAVLSDIMGDEDHLGDMDFKVAGTRNGLTALQMDIKITGITVQILGDAIKQAEEGRLFILDKMDAVISESSKNVAETAPKIKSFQIRKEKIRAVIGQGGSVIKDICATSGATVEIADDGIVSIFSNSQEAIDMAYSMVGSHAFDAEVGSIHKGSVVKVIEHGAIVEFMRGKTGLVHISELCDSRVDSVSDVVTEGNSVFVKVLHDDGNRIKLSMKSVDQETGKDISHLLTQR